MWGVVIIAKSNKNRTVNLYFQLFICNMFLLFVRYLHGGRHLPSELGVLIISFELIGQTCLLVKESCLHVFLSKKHVFMSEMQISSKE